MKWIDLPPVWLLCCLVIAWNAPGHFTPGVLSVVGMSAVVVGLGLTGAAVVTFLSARTTIIPREAPSALITAGVFNYTRNPIYLADVLFLLGLSLVWGSAVGILLVPVFAVFLERRFIRPEEAVLTQAFGAEFEAYAGRVRRWV